MTCKECKARLYPEDPTATPKVLRGGRWLLPLCHSCPRYETPEYFVEQLLEKGNNPETVCKVDGCPIWKTVAQLKTDIQALQAELTHVRKQALEKKSSSKEGYW